MKTHNKFLIFIILISVLFSGKTVKAQSEGPIYIVQSGDTLGEIASRFGISTDQLIQANPSIDPNLMYIGTELIIPGLENITGILTSKVIDVGESFYSLSQKYQIEPTQLARINRITSPAEAYAGYSLIVPQQDGIQSERFSISLINRQSPLELAAMNGVNPWALHTRDDIPLWVLLPNEVLYVPIAPTQTPDPTSNIVENLTISPLPLVQGETAEIRIQSSQNIDLLGSLNGRPLHFFQLDDNTYVAIQGLHAMTDPGLVEFSISATAFDGHQWSISQWVVLEPGFYTTNTRLIVDPETIDYQNTQPEDELIKGYITPATDLRHWTGVFVPPVDVPVNYSLDPDCITDRFGNRRAYNDGPFNYFHTGLDLSACGNNLNIYASAPGIVVFSAPLTVRGTFTLIDHGWGIYSGYGHQAESLVTPGDFVEAGQLIGIIGDTGRVTGPHLHWEIWANGVQVQPLDWLSKVYPSTR